MKVQSLFSVCLALFLSQASPVSAANFATSPAQDTVPSTNTQTGYWNLERNIRTPKTCTLYFYNEAHEQVYQENVTGKKIRVRSRRTCKKLDGILQEALLAYEQRRSSFANEMLVARAMGRKN